METKTKNILRVLAVMALIVASSFAGLGYLANHDAIAKVTGAFEQAPDVRAIHKRADLMLDVCVALWLVAAAVFPSEDRKNQVRWVRVYVISALITGLAIAMGVAVLHIMAKALKLI